MIFGLVVEGFEVVYTIVHDDTCYHIAFYSKGVENPFTHMETFGSFYMDFNCANDMDNSEIFVEKYGIQAVRFLNALKQDALLLCKAWFERTNLKNNE